MSRAPSPQGLTPADSSARQSSAALRGRHDDLEAVLAGVAGPRDEAFADGGSRERLERLGGSLRSGKGLPHLRARVRALHRDHREIVALADAKPGCAFRGEAGEPREVLLRGRGVHHDAKPRFAEEVHDEVVEHVAGGVEQARVERLAGLLQLVDVVGQGPAQEIAGRRALDVEHAHVRHVEHAGIAPHGVMLVDLRAVVQRHVPAAEIDHPGAVLAVQGVERSGADQGVLPEAQEA